MQMFYKKSTNIFDIKHTDYLIANERPEGYVTFMELKFPQNIKEVVEETIDQLPKEVIEEAKTIATKLSKRVKKEKK